MTHIMLDLETWGKVPGSDIRSIGAVVFDPIDNFIWTGKDEGGTFYVATENPIEHGKPWTSPSEIKPWKYRYPLTRDPETVQWWNDQTPEAQAAFVNPVDLKNACEHFTSFVCNAVSVAPPEGLKELRLWANDPHFDVSILDAVFRAVGLPVPWHYRSPRSMKTITEAAGMTSADYSNLSLIHI